MTRRTQGTLMVVVAAVLWSFSGVAVKNLPGVGPLVITGWRSLFTLPIVLLAFWLDLGGARSGSDLRGTLTRPAVWGSAVCYSLMLILFISATCMTTAANAIFLQYTAPLWVALLSWPLLGERVGLREWGVLAGCLTGMACFFADQLSFAGWWGNVVAIVSGVACGLNMLFLRLLSRGEGGAAGGGMGQSLPAMFLGNLLTVLICAPWALAGVPETPFVWGVLLFMGIVQLGVPYVLFNLGLMRITAVEGVLYAMLEAVLNPIWTLLGAGERPGSWALVGGGVILAVVTWFGISRSRDHAGGDLPGKAGEPYEGRI